MTRRALALLPLFVALGFAPTASPQDKKAAPEKAKATSAEPTLEAAHGVVDKSDKDSLTIKPRAGGGQFQKAVTLHVTGTSKVTLVTTQTRSGKAVLTQRDADVKDLTAGQAVAVIYAEAGTDGPVLLSAVAQPTTGK
jgi:hypothetical protein